TLLESVAHQSAKKIEHFNEIAFQDPEKAKVEAHKIVEWERSRKAKRIKTIKDTQDAKADEERKNKDLNDKLEKIESELKDTKSAMAGSQTQIEVLSARIDKQDKRIRKIIWSLIATVIIAAISFTGFYFYESLNFIVKIFNWIMSAGALFSLGNFILNAIKFFKGK
ncbi:MAG: hypothetical protein ACOCUT_02750, partial [bacterium]